MGDIERRSRVFREDARDFHARRALESYRQYRLGCIRTSLSLLRKASLPKRILVSARLKRLESVHRKMRRHRDHLMPAHEMQDIIGFRLVCESLDQAVALGRELRDKVPGTRIKDYIQTKHPHSLGYRAIHAVTRFRQPFLDTHVTVNFEVQIRTWYQHLWACWCESFGEQAKEGFANRERVVPEKVGEQKRLLVERSQQIARWEEKHRGDVQKKLPQFSDGYHLAVAWTAPGGRFHLHPCGTSATTAVKYVRDAESRRDSRVLLLAGVTGSPDPKHLERTLAMTHPNFVKRGPYLDPRDWIPEGA